VIIDFFYLSTALHLTHPLDLSYMFDSTEEYFVRQNGSTSDRDMYWQSLGDNRRKQIMNARGVALPRHLRWYREAVIQHLGLHISSCRLIAGTIHRTTFFY
jgi:hypothetical protein